MATNLGKQAKRFKKIFMGGMLLPPENDGPTGMQSSLQVIYNQWLGFNAQTDEPQLKVSVTELEKLKKYRFDFFRVYGDFYKFCPSSDQNTRIFCWDEQILLGYGYETGTTADFEHYNGRYIIYHGIKDFTKKYKEAAKALGGCSIKKLEYEQIDRDNIRITVML